MQLNQIDRITPEQQSKLNSYVEQWIQPLLRTTPIEVDQIQSAIESLYEKILKQPLPSQIKILSTPQQCQYELQSIEEKAISLAVPLAKMNEQLQKKLECHLSFDTAFEIYHRFYFRFHTLFNESVKTESKMQAHLEYIAPQWNSEIWSELCRYGFYDFVLQEILPDQKIHFKTFAEWIKILPHLHQCWLFEKTAVVSHFPNAAEPDHYQISFIQYG